FKDAIPLLEEAHRAAQKYPTLRWVTLQLLDASRKAGEHVKFANPPQEQLAEARKALPAGSLELAGLLAQISLGLLEQQKWTQAEPLRRECLTSRVKKAPDDWLTFSTKSQLGAALLGQKKYAEAQPLLLAGYAGLKQREKAIPAQLRQTRLTEAID